MTFAIHTFGCKVNIYESEFIIDLLNENGYKMVDFSSVADIYIINTCTVTNEADKKVRKMINSVRKKHNDAILIVMGCYSQLNSDLIDADIIIGNKYKSEIINLIEEFIETKKKIVRIVDLSKTDFENMSIRHFANHTRAFVKIQEGCNAFCSYCIISYARGGIRSKPFMSVIKEVEELVNNGYKEIVLTGIHTGQYGKEIGTDLESLLLELVKIDGIFRIRLSSIEINEITDGIIELIKNNDIMAKHLHIPIQSGCEEILKLMNRRYSLKFFLDKIDYIRNEIEDISITTDLIVGFPFETDEYFNETIRTLNKIKFSKIHVFPYSKRSGTKAAVMDNQVDEKVKKCRVREIISLSEKYEKEFYQNRINKIYDGIVETRNDGKKMVISSNYIQIEVLDELNSNEVITVKITDVINNKVIGNKYKK